MAQRPVAWQARAPLIEAGRVPGQALSIRTGAARDRRHLRSADCARASSSILDRLQAPTTRQATAKWAQDQGERFGNPPRGLASLASRDTLQEGCHAIARNPKVSREGEANALRTPPLDPRKESSAASCLHAILSLPGEASPRPRAYLSARLSRPTKIAGTLVIYSEQRLPVMAVRTYQILNVRPEY